MFPNGGACLTTHIWQHYLYSRDVDFLKEYYPVIKGTADFYLDYMQPVGVLDGKYVFGQECSIETIY